MRGRVVRGAPLLALLAPLVVTVTVVPACKNTLDPDTNTWPALLSEPAALDDTGPVNQNTILRGVLELGMRNRSALETAVLAEYTTGSPTYRKYMTADEFDQTYGPLKTDLDTITAWLSTNGLSLERVSSRALLIEFSGPVVTINTAFGFILHDFHPKSAMPSDATGDIYATLTPPAVPAGLPSSLVGLLGFAPQFPSETTEKPPTLQMASPTTPSMALVPQQVADYYGFTSEANKGNTGAGARLGIVAGYAYHDADAEGFWDGFRVVPSSVTEKSTIGSQVFSYGSTTTEAVEWSGALAPGASISVYEIPDASVISTVYALHEAVGRAEVDVVSDPFSHREDLLSPAITRASDDAGLLGAALGITVLAGSGNSSGVDIPGSSSWITSVGGTTVSVDSSGDISGEKGWVDSGCGTSLQVNRPSWQPDNLGSVSGFSSTGREVCDVSANAGLAVWMVNGGAWSPVTGSTASVSIMAAGVTIANQVRVAAGLPKLGWLNKRLYESTALQAAFRDQTSTDATNAPAGSGWDCSTGWGSLNLTKMASADW
jgi:kumamolisin